jgi:hypothetical protein
MEYTGEDCSATLTTQDANKWNGSGDPAMAATVYIIANDDDNPNNGDIWFEGTVSLNSTFLIDAANAGQSKLSSNTVIHIFDQQGGTIIQTVNFHTSCSQPLAIDDQWGAARLESMTSEDGDVCGTIPPPPPPDPCPLTNGGTIASDGTDCVGLVEYPVTVEDDCLFSLDDVQMNFRVMLDMDADGTVEADITDEVVVSGSYPDYALTAELPMGSHILRLTAYDPCGNAASENLPFEVIDCSVAAPDVYQGLVAELLPIPPGIDADGDGDIDYAAVQILATYLVQSPLQLDCNGPLSFSINRMDEEPHINKQSIIFTCDDIEHNDVEVWAWDNANNPQAEQADGSEGGRNSAMAESSITILNIEEICGSGLQSPGVLSVEEGKLIPELFQNEPNPFAEQTTIRFWLPETDQIELSVYDLTGREVKVFSGMYEAGYHQVQLDQEDFHSYGMFFYTLRTASFVDTKQMINLKY